MGYDDFSRLKSRTTTGGNALSDSWSYDRYGNRWSQTASPGGYQQQLPVNAANNQAVGFLYDAAGNLLNDSVHGYSYDAEGNMTAVDGGSQVKYFYDAANHRVRTEAFGNTYEVLFNLEGQKTVIWNVGTGSVEEEDARLGVRPLVAFLHGSLNYEHQDWLGTERLLTKEDGSVQGSYDSLPFGDGFSSSGTDVDPYHFSGLEPVLNFAPE